MPFTFILILTALKELFEDIKRHRADRKENSAKTQVYNQSTGKFQEIEWKDINPGDVLKVEDGKSFPADLILVASAEPQGISYIGKKHALKKYDQFALNTSCLYPSCAISRNFVTKIMNKLICYFC